MPDYRIYPVITERASKAPTPFKNLRRESAQFDFIVDCPQAVRRKQRFPIVYRKLQTAAYADDFRGMPSAVFDSNLFARIPSGEHDEADDHNPGICAFSRRLALVTSP
jgi:hypothetical protein